MKRIIAVFLTLIMIMALAGCGEKTPEILGTYECSFDATDLLVENIDAGLGAEGTETVRDYLQGKLEFVSIVRFNEDGTYVSSVSIESVEAVLSDVKLAAMLLIEDVLLQSLIDSFAEDGIQLSTKEEVEALLGTSVEQAYKNSGLNVQELVDEVFTALSPEEMVEASKTEGNYKAENGKLYMSDSLEDQCDESAYETYTVEGDIVTVTGGVNMGEAEDYPFTFVKIA